MSGRGICGALAAACLLLIAPAGATALQDAIESRDVLKLEELSRVAASPGEAQLAAGAALSLRHKDEAALAILQPLSNGKADASVRAGACWALADIYIRQGRYAEAHGALLCAQNASGKPLAGEALQVLAYTGALAGEKPMRLVKPAAGALMVRHDAAGLLRVGVEINGSPKYAVLDTDASFSVLSESAAERLGVREIDAPLTIITSTRSDQPMRLGIADEMKFGDAVLSNVVFAVLPDTAMNFGHGYRMDAVVGLPVFVALGRIELAREDGAKLFYGARPNQPAVAAANMALSALDPFGLVKDERSGAVLRLAIDSAATKTTLNGTALRQFPALSNGSSSGWAHWHGAGGERSDTKARTLRELKLSVSGRTIALSRVQVLSLDERDRHGAIGLDLLKQGSRWVIDFENMSFAVLD